MRRRRSATVFASIAILLMWLFFPPELSADAKAKAKRKNKGRPTTTRVASTAPPVTSAPPTTGAPPGKRAQTIAFDPLADRALTANTFAIGATATSGLAVVFVAKGSCTVEGTTVAMRQTGTCEIIATQGGDAVWSPADPVTRKFTVTEAPAPATTPPTTRPVSNTINFAPIAPSTFRSTGGPMTIPLVATASSGVTVKFRITENPNAGSINQCELQGDLIVVRCSARCTVEAYIDRVQGSEGVFSISQEVVVGDGVSSLIVDPQSSVPKFDPSANVVVLTGRVDNGPPIVFLQAEGSCVRPSESVQPQGTAWRAAFRFNQAGTCDVTVTLPGTQCFPSTKITTVKLRMSA